MKELRFEADNGLWRVAYAFDPACKERFVEHLEELEKARKKR
jgi:hypothetical protein